jgi:hypothetical protein
MGTIAQDILRKYHGLEARKEVKPVIDEMDKGMDKKDSSKEKKDDVSGKKDDRNLGDSAADAKKASEQPEK